MNTLAETFSQWAEMIETHGEFLLTDRDLPVVNGAQDMASAVGTLVNIAETTEKDINMGGADGRRI